MEETNFIPMNKKEDYINSWYVFHVKSGREAKIINIFRDVSIQNNLNIDFVTPTAVRFEKRGFKRVKVLKPVFPGYVFANGCISASTYNLLMEVPDVYSLLRDKESFDIMPVPKEEMELLDKIMNVHGVIDSPVLDFDEGGNAVIVKGPMASLTGRIEWINKHARKMKLLVPFLGEERAVIVGFSFVEPVVEEI